MIQLSQASFLNLARRFASPEEFARWLIDNRFALRAERASRKAAQGGLVESGLRVVSRTQPDSVSSPSASPEGLAHPRVKLAVARKAIPLLAVTPNAQAVMAALLDFCNVDTLRCFPGLDHIALKLGRSGQKDPRRHIRRGIADLVEAGLLKVAAHGGMRHANAYFPQWDRLAAVVAAFEAGEHGAGRVRVQSDSPDRIVPQTQKKIPTSVEVKRVQRARAAEPDRRQRQLPLVSVVPPGIPREQAGLRVMQALSAHLRGRPPRFAERVRADIDAELLEAAITAEVREKGRGIAVILEGLGPGPPGPLPEVSETLRKKLG